MNTIEQQVVSLDLAKQLKEAGYKQEGLWWWKPDMITKGKDVFLQSESALTMQLGNHKTIAVAPTVAELGEALPETIKKKPDYRKKDEKEIYTLEYHEKGLSVEYIYYYYEPCDYITIKGNTEANARAKMWIYLRKEGLL